MCRSDEALAWREMKQLRRLYLHTPDAGRCRYISVMAMCAAEEGRGLEGYSSRRCF